MFDEIRLHIIIDMGHEFWKISVQMKNNLEESYEDLQKIRKILAVFLNGNTLLSLAEQLLLLSD